MQFWHDSWATSFSDSFPSCSGRVRYMQLCSYKHVAPLCSASLCCDRIFCLDFCNRQRAGCVRRLAGSLRRLLYLIGGPLGCAGALSDNQRSTNCHIIGEISQPNCSTNLYKFHDLRLLALGRMAICPLSRLSRRSAGSSINACYALGDCITYSGDGTIVGFLGRNLKFAVSLLVWIRQRSRLIGGLQSCYF